MTELDPDAPTRQRRRLDVENAQGEEMLTAHLWKLVRAGAALVSLHVSWGSAGLKVWPTVRCCRPPGRCAVTELAKNPLQERSRMPPVPH